MPDETHEQAQHSSAAGVSGGIELDVFHGLCQKVDILHMAWFIGRLSISIRPSMQLAKLITNVIIFHFPPRFGADD